MKQLTIILTLLILSSTQLFAQWQPEVQLTNNTAPSDNTAAFDNTLKKSIAVSGNTVHIIWCDRSDEIWQIYYKRSTNGGVTWQAVQRLTNTVVSTFEPVISVSGEIVNVFWTNEANDMYQKRSLNSGITWSTETKLTDDLLKARYPSVAATGSILHLVWVYKDKIYYRTSTNAGSSWGANVTLASSFGNRNPLVAVSGKNVHVVWQGHAGGQKIYYNRSTDGGKTWGTEKNLPEKYNPRDPSIAVSDQAVYVIWLDYATGSTNAAQAMYLKRSPDGGMNWRTDKELPSTPNHSISNSISVSGQNVHVLRTGPLWKLYYKRSINGGVSWEADTLLTNTAPVYSPSIFGTGQTVHVIWDNHKDIFYKRLLKEPAKKLIPKGQTTTTTTPSEEKSEDKTDEQKDQKGDELKIPEEKKGNEKKADGKNDTEKWVITPSGAKGATGTVSITLPEGLEWHLDIKSSEDKALGKWDDRWNNKKTINLIPGKYNILFTYIPLLGVPIQKGMNTRLKAGILNVVTAGQWVIWNEEKTKAHVVYYKPSKIGLPVGKYYLQYNEQYIAIEIKEGEVTEF